MCWIEDVCFTQTICLPLCHTYMVIAVQLACVTVCTVCWWLHLLHVDTEPFPSLSVQFSFSSLHRSHSVFPLPVPPPSPTCLRYGWTICPSSQCQETGVDSLQSTIQGSTHFTYVIHVLQCQLNSSMLSLSSVMMKKQWRRCWISARRCLSQTELFVPMIFCS